MDGGTDGITYNTDADGDPKLFNVNRNDSEPWLNNNNGHMDYRWNGYNRFVFRSSILFRFSSKIWVSFILHSRAVLPAVRSNHPAFCRFRGLVLTGKCRLHHQSSVFPIISTVVFLLYPIS